MIMKYGSIRSNWALKTKEYKVCFVQQLEKLVVLMNYGRQTMYWTKIMVCLHFVSLPKWN